MVPVSLERSGQLYKPLLFCVRARQNSCSRVFFEIIKSLSALPRLIFSSRIHETVSSKKAFKKVELLQLRRLSACCVTDIRTRLLPHFQLCLAGMVPGIASRHSWPWPTLVASLALPLAGRFPVCESFAVRPSRSTAPCEVHVHADASHVMLLGSAKGLGAPRARAWALASRCGRVYGQPREYLLSTPFATSVCEVLPNLLLLQLGSQGVEASPMPAVASTAIPLSGIPCKMKIGTLSIDLHAAHHPAVGGVVKKMSPFGKRWVRGGGWYQAWKVVHGVY